MNHRKGDVLNLHQMYMLFNTAISNPRKYEGEGKDEGEVAVFSTKRWDRRSS